jgi:putative membrane protein
MYQTTFKSTACGIAVAALLACGAVRAQQDATRPAGGDTATATKSGGKSELAQADRKFIAEAASGGMAEVELGKLAQAKASSEQVKQFGARMVADHSKANDELKQLAQAKGVAVPAAADKSHHGEMSKLDKLSGADFDRQYMSHMVSDHRKDVSDFKKASESAKDGDLKAWAEKTLPTLQEHLKLAQSVNDSVKSAAKQ